MNLKTIISSGLFVFYTGAIAQTIHFNWEKDYIGNKLIENIAMSVPFIFL